MTSILKTVDNQVVEIEKIEPGAWIHMINPNQKEIDFIVNSLQVEPSFVRSALDESETSRIEVEDNNQTLIMVDVPSAEKNGETISYSTLPLGIIVTSENIITVCLKDVAPLQEMCENHVKNVQTNLKTRFILMMLLRIATQYLQYLRQVEKISSYIEKQLYKSQRNKELIQLLDLEKSLVYFSTSLKANEATLEKLFRGRIIKMYEDDRDLLEDVLIEFRQAIEMASIYTSILSETRDAFASIISNNLNVIMKILTSLTILLTVPNVVFGFYGMNVTDLPVQYTWFPSVIAVVLVAVIAFVLKKKNLF